MGLSCRAAKPLEPERGIYLGAWLDTTDLRDTPTAFNQRLRRRAAFFQFSEPFPLNFSSPPPWRLVEETDTNAILYLTIYTTRVVGVTDADIGELVRQVGGVIKAQVRPFFLRLNPEMNGNWFAYGQQPLAYKVLWKRVYTAFQADPYCRGEVAFLWSPNSGKGYPYGKPVDVSPEERAALDTNRDGRLDDADDPYSPYYPGDAYVDWVGLSFYYYGPKFPWLENRLPPPDFAETLLHGPEDGDEDDGYEDDDGKADLDFYTTYSQEKGLPFFLSETNAAFHVRLDDAKQTPISPGPGMLAIKRTLWRQYLTNATFLRSLPNLKAVCLFEFLKPEELTIRDFRVTGPDTLDAFLVDLEGVASHYLFATEGATVLRGGHRNSGSEDEAGWMSFQMLSMLLLCAFISAGVAALL